MEFLFSFTLGQMCDPFAFLGYLAIGFYSRRWWWTVPLVAVYAVTYEYLAFLMLPTNGFPNESILTQFVGGMVLSSIVYFVKYFIRRRKRIASVS